MIAGGWVRLPETSGRMSVAFKRGETTALAPDSLLTCYNEGLMALPGCKKLLLFMSSCRGIRRILRRLAIVRRDTATGLRAPRFMRRHAGRVAAVCPISRRVRVTSYVARAAGALYSISQGEVR